MDGIQRVSARDKILREIISNLLMHRDFSSGYVPKLLIERDTITTENANLVHGHGNLNLKTFKPFAKNPPIAKVFREIGLADELGSGMRNSYKYTKMYSGGEPVFTEADVFTIVIPLSEAATATVGPITQDNTEATTQEGTEVSMEVDTQVKLPEEKLAALLDYCKEARSRREMQKFCGIKTAEYFRKHIIKPMLSEGLIRPTIPDKPNSSKQKYIRV